MEDFYSLNELLLMRHGRGHSIDEIRDNMTAYKSEKDADRKVFFRYLTKWELKDIFDDYYKEKDKNLSKSWLSFIEMIFSINDSGFRPRFNLIIKEKQSGKILVNDIVENSKKDIRNTIRKGIESLDLNDREISDTYQYLFMTLSNLFGKETVEIQQKYLNRLRNNRISLESENYMTYKPTTKMISEIPKNIIDSKSIPQDSKFSLLEEFYSECGKLLDKWESIIGK